MMGADWAVEPDARSSLARQKIFTEGRRYAAAAERVRSPLEMAPPPRILERLADRAAKRHETKT